MLPPVQLWRGPHRKLDRTDARSRPSCRPEIGEVRPVGAALQQGWAAGELVAPIEKKTSGLPKL